MKLASCAYLWTRVEVEYNERISTEAQNSKKQVLQLLLPVLTQFIVAELKVNNSLPKIISYLNSKSTKIEAVWTKVATDNLAEGIIVLDESNEVRCCNQ